MIGECEDASQSLPPSHQRLTERIVGVTVHATVLSLRLSLRDSCCGGSDASYGEVGGVGGGREGCWGAQDLSPTILP